MALEKAQLITEKGTKIPVQFNPAEYNLSSSVNYSEKNIPGTPGPITQFVSGASSTLNLSLTFDTFNTAENGVREFKNGGGLTDIEEHKPTDVSKLTRKVSELMDIEGSLHRPPIVTFAWGALKFKGVITELKQTFTMFMPDGMPVRARVELAMKSVTDITAKKKESPFESPDRTKYLTVHEGEQLWNYAQREYGDPEQWRVIAKENGMLDPLDIHPGQILKLPAL